MTGSTHQPPLCRLRRQQPAKKERKPCGLHDRTACSVRRFAPAERRSFSRLGRCRVFPMLGKMVPKSSNVWKIRPGFFQSLENVFWLHSLIPTPAAFQVSFSPGSVNSTRRSPPLQARPPNAAGQFPRVCAYGANVAAICLFGGKTCRALFSFSRPASPGSLRAHPSRHGATSCHAGCYALRSRDADTVIFPSRSPTEGGGFGTKNVLA